MTKEYVPSITGMIVNIEDEFELLRIVDHENLLILKIQEACLMINHHDAEWVSNWIKYSMFGTPIANTNIIPCKVPLDDVYVGLFAHSNQTFYNMESLLRSLLET